MARAFALALTLATAVCGVKGSPRPPLPPATDAGFPAAVDGGIPADGGSQ
ncbi:MAG: hypothetical protein ACJ78W_09820 [Myxococcales bacterium]